MRATTPPTVAFAGGGTGGHIYPNVGIAEAFADLRPGARAWFVVSDRPGDAKTMDALGFPFTVTSARPLPSLRKPTTALGFAWGWAAAATQTVRLFRNEGVRAVVATGGFVSGPAVMAARMLGIPAVMVNLDAIPGAANRSLVRLCRKVFTAYRSDRLPDAQVVGLPLRAASRSPLSAAEARQSMGLAPDRRVLFVTGATHGAESIIAACMALVEHDPEFVRALQGWQVLHQCGTFDVARLQAAYDRAGVAARVVDYLAHMGTAYAGSDLVLSRAGAGSVGEAWGNGTPTVFVPNPYHADQHQRHNAQPMVDAGGAVLVSDLIEPDQNVRALGPVLRRLLQGDAERIAMRAKAEASRPPDGASAVAHWLDANLA